MVSVIWESILEDKSWKRKWMVYPYEGDKLIWKDSVFLIKCVCFVGCVLIWEWSMRGWINQGVIGKEKKWRGKKEKGNGLHP